MDISLGGVCLELPATEGLTDQAEVRINLTDMWLKALWEKRAQVEKSEVETLISRTGESDGENALKPLKLIGKTRYAHLTKDGATRIGLKFSNTYSEDSLRLARTLLDVFES